MNHSHQRGYVAEAKGSHQTSLWRRRAQVELLTQPGQVRVMAKHRIHTVQRTVRRQHTVAQHLGQTNQLECGSTALGVTGQGLLRNDKQRVTSIAAHRRCDALMQVRLIRVIGIGGDRKSTRLNSSHVAISYAVFCLKKKTQQIYIQYQGVLLLTAIESLQ